MKNYLKYLALVTLVLSSSIAQSQDPNFHIYLMFGQSNMEGAGTIESQDRTDVDPRFRVMGATNCTANRSFTIGEWSTANPPLVRCYTNLGIGDYFGRTMVAELPDEIKVGVVPVAVGGCDIALFDKENYADYVATAPSWMEGIIEAYGGNPYGRLVEVARLAQKDGVIKGIIFHQGETNTNDRNWKNEVSAVLENLKQDLDLDDIPFLAGELLAGEGSCCSSHNTEVNKLPDVIPNAHVISSNELIGADNAHFNSASYRIFGERYATKMLELINADVEPVTAIESQLSQDQISLYPVPAINGAFAIQNTQNIILVELFDMMGKIISSHENNNASNIMNIQVKGNSGILLVKLFDGQKSTYRKVKIQ